MSRFKVTKILPAEYTESYLVDAASEDEAQRLVAGGGARCAARYFSTLPGTVRTKINVSQVADQDSPVADKPEDVSGFANGHFTTDPGKDLQHVFQKIDN